METATLTWERHPIEEVERANQRNGGHFFDADAKRFFRSRIANDCWTTDVNVATDTNHAPRRVRVAMFRTSERHVNPFAEVNEPRGYTVRLAFWSLDGTYCYSMDDVGEFQQYTTARQADGVMRHVREWWTSEEVAGAVAPHVRYWDT